MNLSLYKFNQSFKQIRHKIDYDKTMIGVYAVSYTHLDVYKRQDSRIAK